MTFLIKNIISKRIILILGFFSLGFIAPLSNSLISVDTNTDKEKFFAPVISQLLIRGVSNDFIKLVLNDSRVSFNPKIVKINVLGQSTKADYTKTYNDKAVEKSKQFLADNIEVLTKVEEKYGVPKEVITSLLWIETKHGTYTGSNQIVSVFFSAAMANQKEYLDQNIQNLKDAFQGTDEELIEQINKVKNRSNKKTEWALNELVALEKLSKISPTPVLELQGSWAGAFGWSQFLPSSYISWAVDGDNDGKIDLFNKIDAIYSVANYLKTNGWKDTEEAKKAAVFHYNNSTEYVNAVLTLAEKIKKV